jgi:hypothetical protein
LLVSPEHQQNQQRLVRRAPVANHGLAQFGESGGELSIRQPGVAIAACCTKYGYASIPVWLGALTRDEAQGHRCLIHAS